MLWFVVFILVEWRYKFRILKIEFVCASCRKCERICSWNTYDNVCVSGL